MSDSYINQDRIECDTNQSRQLYRNIHIIHYGLFHNMSSHNNLDGININVDLIVNRIFVYFIGISFFNLFMIDAEYSSIIIDTESLCYGH